MTQNLNQLTDIYFRSYISVQYPKRYHHTCTSTGSLQKRRYFLAFFRRAEGSTRRALSMSHARREGREKNHACPHTIVHAVPPRDTPPITNQSQHLVWTTNAGPTDPTLKLT